MIRRIVRSAALVLVSALALAGCAGGPEVVGVDAAEPLTVVVGGELHAAILEKVAELAEGTVDVRVLSSESDPNTVVEDGEADLAYAQHRPAFDGDVQELGYTDLRVVAPVHVVPYGIFSQRYASIADIPHGATVLIPSAPASRARALYLLQQAGLITLDREFGGTDIAALSITQDDVIESERHLNIVETHVESIPDLVDVADAIVVPPDVARDAGFGEPRRVALLLEPGKDNPFANVLVAPDRLLDDPRTQLLARFLESAELAAWIDETYSGAVIAASEVGVRPAPSPAVPEVAAQTSAGSDAGG